MDPPSREPPSAHTAGATGTSGVMGSLCGAALGDVHGAGPRAAGRGDSIRTESGKIAGRNTQPQQSEKHYYIKICLVSYFFVTRFVTRFEAVQ